MSGAFPEGTKVMFISGIYKGSTGTYRFEAGLHVVENVKRGGHILHRSLAVHITNITPIGKIGKLLYL